MRVDWALACRSAIGSGGIVDLQGVGIDTLWVSELPARVSLPVIARIAGWESECGPDQPHQIEGILRGPGMSVLETLEFQLTMEARPEHPSGYEVTILLPLIVQLLAEQEGNHGLEIRIDGRFQWLVYFFVRVGSPA